jgi:soluble epoxide hydrolase/lipid-phosphate phosphatase
MHTSLRHLSLLPLTAGIASALPAANASYSDFDPSSYQKTFAKCLAADRGGLTPINVELNIAYLDVNPTAEKVIIMPHGWPSSWTTYRNQIQTLGKDYRLIIPEHRGYGDSSHRRMLTIPQVC